jgi:hypothetical protein
MGGRIARAGMLALSQVPHMLVFKAARFRVSQSHITEAEAAIAEFAASKDYIHNQLNNYVANFEGTY